MQQQGNGAWMQDKHMQREQLVAGRGWCMHDTGVVTRKRAAAEPPRQHCSPLSARPAPHTHAGRQAYRRAYALTRPCSHSTAYVCQALGVWGVSYDASMLGGFLQAGRTTGVLQTQPRRKQSARRQQRAAWTRWAVLGRRRAAKLHRAGRLSHPCSPVVLTAKVQRTDVLQGAGADARC